MKYFFLFLLVKALFDGFCMQAFNICLLIAECRYNMYTVSKLINKLVTEVGVIFKSLQYVDFNFRNVE